VDIRRELCFGRHGNPAPRNPDAIGLFQRDLEMRGVHRRGDFVPQFREKFSDQAASGESIAVLRLDKLLLDHSLGVKKEVPGSSHALELPNSLGIQYVVSLDHLRVDVREQREVDLLPGAVKGALFRRGAANP
jgi:hypothetical protein